MKNLYEEALKKNVNFYVILEISLPWIHSYLGLGDIFIGRNRRCFLMVTFTLFGNSFDVVIDRWSCRLLRWG